MSTGVLLSRCQPIHAGHLQVLKQMLEENDKVALVIGSAGKNSTERNPFDIKYRYELVEKALKYKGLYDKIQVATLNDISSDEDIPKQDNTTGSVDNANSVNEEWSNYLYYNLVNITGDKYFNFYYNDDISLVREWFASPIMERIQIKSCGRIEGLSSSKVRAALKWNNFDPLVKALPYLDTDELYRLRDTLEEIEYAKS